MSENSRIGSARRRKGDMWHSAPGESKLEIDTLLEYLISVNASDLHLSVGLPPMARIDGALVAIPDTTVITPEMSWGLLHEIMSEEQRREFDVEWEIDFSVGRRGLGRYRVNAFMESGQAAAAFRRIPDVPPTLEELGLPPVLADLTRLRRGLILITGPTGSGKTTTLAAMIHRINIERSEHIVTIEDPVEFQHQHINSIVQQREVGRDTAHFARALRSALREDPDVILIGEMRDLETIAAAVSAAETGHLVLATLHTNSAVQAVDRIIDVFPPNQQLQIRAQLSASLEAVLAQRLVPLAAGGRVAVLEVLLANDAVRNLIREGKTHQIDTAMQSGVKDGMVLFDKVLADHVRHGEVAIEVALRFANDPRGFMNRVGTGVIKL